MNKSFVWELYEAFEEVITSYGPFEFLKEDEIAETPSGLIWSSATVDDGGHIIFGLHNGNAVDWHLKASKFCNLKPFEVDVLEVYVFECPDCDGESECVFCEGEGMVEVDFERFAALVPHSERNLETLWSFRKPDGFEYDH